MNIDLNREWKAIQRHGRRLNEVHGDPVPRRESAEPSSAPDDPMDAAAGGRSVDSPAEEKTPECQPAAEETFSDLVQRANSGEEKAIAALGKVLDENPDVWRKVGDLAAHARLTLVRHIAGGNSLLRDSLQRKAAALRSELTGDECSALEQLAIDRLVSCWLQLQHADAMAAQAHDHLPQAKYWSQRQDQAHRRYDRALTQLTTIRELSLHVAEQLRNAAPMLKINEASKRDDAPAATKGDTG